MMKLRIVVWLITLAMAVNASAAAYVHAQQQEDKLKGGYPRYAYRCGLYLWSVERLMWALPMVK